MVRLLLLGKPRWNGSPRRPFMTGTKLIGTAMQQTHNIIERAFQLASGATSIDEIRKALRREGYSNVDAHLGGSSIKAELKRKFARPDAPTG